VRLSGREENGEGYDRGGGGAIEVVSGLSEGSQPFQDQ
jgi:hypothetical protein